MIDKLSQQSVLFAIGFSVACENMVQHLPELGTDKTRKERVADAKKIFHYFFSDVAEPPTDGKSVLKIVIGICACIEGLRNFHAHYWAGPVKMNVGKMLKKEDTGMDEPSIAKHSGQCISEHFKRAVEDRKTKYDSGRVGAQGEDFAELSFTADKLLGKEELSEKEKIFIMSLALEKWQSHLVMDGVPDLKATSKKDIQFLRAVLCHYAGGSNHSLDSNHVALAGKLLRFVGVSDPVISDLPKVEKKLMVSHAQYAKKILSLERCLGQEHNTLHGEKFETQDCYATLPYLLRQCGYDKNKQTSLNDLIQLRNWVMHWNVPEDKEQYDKAGRLLDTILSDVQQREKLRQKLKEQGSKLTEQGSKLQERESKLQEQGSKLKEQGSQLQKRESQLQKRESQSQKQGSKLQEQESQLQERESKLKERESQLKERESQLQKRESQQSERDAKIKKQIDGLLAAIKPKLQTQESKKIYNTIKQRLENVLKIVKS